jgi:glucose-6-phosphate isomerase
VELALAPTFAQRFTGWPLLEQDRQRYNALRITDLFAINPQRVTDCTVEAAGLQLDYSKHFIDATTHRLLTELAQEAGLPRAIQALFNGETVNNTEKRPALHTALRNPHSTMPDASAVKHTFDRMATLVNAVHSGEWRGYSNQAITDIVNIGIGGSDLGPQMATHALKPFHNSAVRVHFVSNVDPSCLQDLLVHLDPSHTLFIVASKSFTTLETLQNAEAAKRWLLQSAHNPTAIAQHFVAVSTAVKKAQAFGIAEANIFPLWDWVGGRYSLWSAIGLPIALATDMAVFHRLLAGAAEMDQHFATAPLDNNMPVILGLLGFWYQHFWQAHSHVVLPYDHYLRFFPDFLQQLDMESNGKSVNHAGQSLPYASGPVIWGAVGTNGQHSFHQLLHQGTHCIPADFILTLQSHHTECAEQHKHLLANGLAQSQALMVGKQHEQIVQELQAQSLDAAAITALAPHKYIVGNRPSSIISMDLLTPETLGAMTALYEHKVYVQSVLWDINAFDQWGVELGKQLSGPIFEGLQGQTIELDASTASLIARYRQLRETTQK